MLRLPTGARVGTALVGLLVLSRGSAIVTASRTVPAHPGGDGKNLCNDRFLR